MWFIFQTFVNIPFFSTIIIKYIGSTMKKEIVVLIVLISISLACNFPVGWNQGFEQDVATKAAQAFTATAQSGQLLTLVAATAGPPTITVKPADSLNTITPTVSDEDPKLNLGEADWRDTLANGDSFGIKGERTEYYTTMKVEGGKFVFSRDVAAYGKFYWLAYPEPKDLYLEATFETGSCNEDDQYGLVFRAPEYEISPAYFFLVTCDGKFNLMKWLGDTGVLVFEWEKSNAINQGSNQTNVLGVWAQGTTIRLYINNTFVKDLTDTFLTDAGHIGFVYDCRKTPGFSVSIDEIAYWLLP